MKRYALFALAVLLSTAARCPAPHPPSPPQPSQFRLQVYVHDADDHPLITARVYRDNVDSENPFKGGTPAGVGPDAGIAWMLPPQDFNVCAANEGYEPQCLPVPLHQTLTLTAKLVKRPTPPEPPQPPSNPVPYPFTREQLRDWQGDLMIWAPEVGCAPEAKINCGPARGLQKGWVWSLTTPRFNQANREKLYTAAKRMGWTHYAISVYACEINGGYHDLIPTTTCDGYDANLNTVLRELHEHKLIPVCAGNAPGTAVANIDKRLCPMAMNDWDNSGQMWGRLKATAEAFPNALIYIEVPYGAKVPEATGGDEPVVPADGNGGAWIRAAQQRYPNFLGVLHELDPDVPGQYAANLQYLKDANPWYRDLQQVLFETDTYTKFWSDVDVNASVAVNDRLRRDAPWLQGYMSSGTSHPAPTPAPGGDGHFVGELDLNTASGQHIAGDFASWGVTGHITRVEIRSDKLVVTMDNNRPNAWPDTPDRPGMGPLLYSLGLALKVNGQWNYSAPIQLWRGLDGSGGNIADPNVDGTGTGQIAANWFYDRNRWGPLAGYQPKEGEVFGVFVCAGDCRDGNPSFSPVHERSNVVLIPMPSKSGGTFVQ